MSNPKEGAPVIWTQTKGTLFHSRRIEHEAVYIKKLRHTVKWLGPQMAEIHIKGKKRTKNVPYKELYFL